MRRWILRQQIGLLAHWLREYILTAHYTHSAKHREARDRLQYGLEMALDEHGWWPESLRTLPPSTLYLLSVVRAGNLSSAFSGLQQSVAYALQDIVEQPYSLFFRVQDWIHHLLNAPGAPSRVVRLGNVLFPQAKWSPRLGRLRTRWAEIEAIPQDMEQFAELATALKDHRFSTAQRLELINQLVRLIDREPFDKAEAAQIENLLLQQTFCWPLLVIEEGRVETGFSIPLAVDARLAVNAEITDPAFQMGWRGFLIEGGDNFDLAERDDAGRTWEDYLSHSATIARDLWRSTHGHYGSFRDRVRFSIADFDLSIADQIVEPLLKALRWTHLPLKDGSAVPYISQFVLGRLLGKRWHHLSAVTGLVGNQRAKSEDGKELLDYDVLPSGSFRKKLWYLLASRQVERVIVSAREPMQSDISEIVPCYKQEGHDGRRNRFVQNAEVIRAYRMSNVADVFQIDGWRRCSYVRLPEIAWAVHSPGRPGLLGIRHDEVQIVIKALANSVCPVQEINNVSPAAVASALWYVNTVMIPRIIPKMPPRLSWCFIRAIDEEQDGSFWRVLWRLIGAPQEEFERFRSAPTVEAATAELEQALDRYEPDEDRPSHRAPDFIVLTDYRVFEQNFAKIRDGNPAHRPVAVSPILDCLRRRNLLGVAPIRHDQSELGASLGRVRFLLLSDSPPPQLPCRLPDCSADDLEILQALSTFRWGFRQQMADTMLQFCGLRISNLRQLLDDLQSRDVLRNTAGTYFFRADHRQYLQDAVTPSQRALFNLAAGQAMAPYATDMRAMGLAYDVAVLPENVGEARYHLHTAFRCFDELEALGTQVKVASSANGSKNYRILTKNEVRKVQQRLSKFGAYPSWGAVNDLLMSRDVGAAREAYLMACDLIEIRDSHWNKRTALPMHPAHLLARARALWRWQPDDTSRIMAHFQEAVDACDHFPEENSYNKLQVLPYFSNYLYRLGYHADARTLDQQIQTLRPHWIVLPGEWFERCGDEEADDCVASDIYASGVTFAPKFYQLPLKALGAVHRTSATIPTVLSSWLQQDESAIVSAATKALNACKADARCFEGDSTAEKLKTHRILGRWLLASELVSLTRPTDQIRRAMAQIATCVVDASGRR